MVCVFFMGEYKNPAGARYKIGTAGDIIIKLRT